MHSALHTQEEIQEAYDWREACGKTSGKFPPRNNNHPPEINIGDLPRPGVSIISKNLVFYRVWYERFEFFLKRPSVVFL